MSGFRMTYPTLFVLRALIEAGDKDMYGLEIARSARLKSGTVQPILSRLEEAGWLKSTWEVTDAHEVGRPPRHYYRFTEQGAVLAKAACESRLGGSK